MREKSLFPEAEETRSLSNYLYKRGYTCVKSEEARVIDTNALMAEKLSGKGGNHITPAAAEEDGFQRGLAADVLDIMPEDEILGEENENGEDSFKEEPIEQGPSPEELIEQAIEEINQMKAEAQTSLETERKKVLEEAKAQGYQEGKMKAEQEAENARRSFTAEKQQLEEEYDKLLEDIEPNMVDALTDIYEHVFNVELSNYRELIISLISGAMRKTEGGRDIIVHVSKEDYPYVSMQKKQIMAGVTALNTNVEIIEDITLAKNQAMIETGGGIFDCSLGTQLMELNQKIRLVSYEKSVGE